MKVIQADSIRALLTDIFTAAGTPEDIAGYVSSSLVESSLKGVDSHGVMRVCLYVDLIESGWIRPAARPEITRETASMAVVSGHQGFGIYTLGTATNLAVEKAKACQVAAVGLTESTHTGRLGQFVEAAAGQGTIAIIAGGGAHGKPGAVVAPHGGAGRILSTNPFAFGLPAGRFGAVSVDIATSTSAEGKLQVIRARREPLPAGWILDREGRPSTDAEDFYAGGMLLPAAGHKGYGLAVVAELLGHALLGPVHELNWLVIALDISAFRPADEFARAGEEFLGRLKEVPPAEGFDEVLIPGEPEGRTAARRAVEGIPIPDATWERMEATARRLGVDPVLYV